MDSYSLQGLFSLAGNVAVVTGGAGVLCGHLGSILADQGVKVAILDIDLQAAEAVAGAITQSGGEAIAVTCNVCDKASLEASCQQILQSFGRVDLAGRGIKLGNRHQFTGNHVQRPGFWEDFRRAEKGSDPQRFLDELPATIDPHPGVFSRQGGGEQLHTVAGGAHGSGVLPRNPCECHCPWFLPDQPEPLLAD
jgi:hypothetical protein